MASQDQPSALFFSSEISSLEITFSCSALLAELRPGAAETPPLGLQTAGTILNSCRVECKSPRGMGACEERGREWGAPVQYTMFYFSRASPPPPSTGPPPPHDPRSPKPRHLFGQNLVNDGSTSAVHRAARAMVWQPYVPSASDRQGRVQSRREGGEAFKTDSARCFERFKIRRNFQLTTRSDLCGL